MQQVLRNPVYILLAMFVFIQAILISGIAVEDVLKLPTISKKKSVGNDVVIQEEYQQYIPSADIVSNEGEILAENPTLMYADQLTEEEFGYEVVPSVEDNTGEVALIERRVHVATESDIAMIAKVMYGEGRGISSKTELACIAWTILNRVDAWGSTIASVVTSANQFNYSSSFSMTSDYGYDLYALAADVVERWEYELGGVENVGRCLPSGYLWFASNGSGHNYFRNTAGYSSPYTYWLDSPYDS